MNTDIRIHINFLQHPKTIKLRKRLGADAVLSIISLWCFVAQNRPEGLLLGMDEEDIEIASGWNGEDGIFVKTLLSLRLLDKEDGVFVVHDWAENNPWVSDVETRSEKAKKAINTRWERERQRRKELEDSYASNTLVIPPNDVSNTPLLSLPSLTLPKKEEDYVREGIVPMKMTEIQKLHVKYLGQIPHSQPVASILKDLCLKYPADRLVIAFQACASSAERPNLGWIKTYLDNPKNWNKDLRQESPRGQPKTFEQMKVENNRKAAQEFAGEDLSDARIGQKEICANDERTGGCVSV